MSLMDLDPQTTLMETVTRLRSDLDELKNRQTIGGDSFESYGMASSGTWDFSSTLSQGLQTTWRITLDFDTVTTGAITRLNAFYRINDSNVMAAPAPRQTSTNPNLDVKWHKVEDADSYAVWDVVIINTSAVPATYTGYVKIFITATASGTFSMEVV